MRYVVTEEKTGLETRCFRQVRSSVSVGEINSLCGADFGLCKFADILHAQIYNTLKDRRNKKAEYGLFKGT